ncbi:YlcI/YnfO family protein [Corynebacterium nuruki]|uniref:YlcI/YnfO family protein n=1 Tax=Corynebacterium nuruki TaxID=1032851 RepID=UPI0039BFDB14
MTTSPQDMTPDQEYEYYSHPENQEPAGPPVRRRPRYGAPVPVRFPAELLARVREEAAKDDRSVSSWIRRAVEHELDHGTG